MELIHNTLLKNIESIKKDGLLKDIKKQRYTERMFICLTAFKPQNLPEFVDLSKCVYLTPANNQYKVHSIIRRDEASISVNSNNLDKNKIYVGPTTIVEKLNSLIMNNCFGENRKEKLTKMIKLPLFKDLCRTYWKNFKPFTLYNILYGRRATLNEQSQWVEVLYFDNIEPDKLIIGEARPDFSSKRIKY